MKTFIQFKLILMLVIFSSNISAQYLEGKISMTVTASNLPPEMEAMKSMFETSITIYSKGNKSRLETTQPMVGEMIVLSDFDKKQSIVCMNLLGDKVAVVSELEVQEDDKDNETDNGTFVLGDKTKMICGYKCKNAIWKKTENDATTEMEVWYNTEIANTSAEFSTLPGMPMEYTMSMGEIKLNYLVTSIEKTKVDDSKFIVPEGYRMTTEAELEKLFPSGK